jgi:ferredoxin
MRGEGEGKRPLKTAVLLCQALAVDPQALGRWLAEAVEGTCPFQVPALCDHPEAVSRFVQESGASRLVLVLCHPDYPRARVQGHARKAGLDPLGVETVVLKEGAGPGAIERAKILLAAAVARAQAFPGSGPQNLKPALAQEIDRGALLRLSFLEYHAVPSLREDLCVAESGCRICIGACPRGALQWSRGRILYDKGACEPCGLCVTACPRGAIVNPAITPAQVEAQVRTLLDPSVGAIRPRGIYFTCQRGREPPGKIHEGWFPVSVPCIGMVTTAWLLAPLAMGAAAVAVLPCSEACPHRQDQVTEGRISYCRSLLSLLGASATLVRTSLDQPPEGPAWRLNVLDPFGPGAMPRLLLALAEALGAPEDTSLEHPSSPLGVLDVNEGVCTGCGRCALACPTGALAWEEGGDGFSLSFDGSLCVACGACLPVCPEKERGALRLTPRTDLALLSRGRRTVFTGRGARCEGCGAPVAPLPMLERLEEVLGPDYSHLFPLLRRYCPQCRATAASPKP